MTSYSIEAVDPRVRNSSQTLELELIGDAARVLDVGCSSGYLGAALACPGRTVTGVERDPEAARVASERLDEVVVADLDGTPLRELFAGRQFDAVVLGDILEHLADPEAALRDAVELLAPGGAVVASIPNVAHGALRLALLQGRWRYRDEGLLDRTHIRFFTRASVLELVHGAGLAVSRWYATVLDPLATEVDVDVTGVPQAVVDWVREQEDALTYQFVLRAVPVAEATGSEPADPEPAIPVPGWADHDRKVGTTEAAGAFERRLAALRTRDALIGMEAQLARAELEIRHVREENEKARREVADVKTSRTWRAGRVVVAPLRAVLGGRRMG